MSKKYNQFQIEVKQPSIEDFISVKEGQLVLSAPLQTQNYIRNKRGVRIEGTGLFASGGSIETSSTITGALTHTGSSAGFYGTTPIAQQTVTFGNTNGEIGGLTISGAYSQVEVQALRDKCEELADDARNLRQAIANLGLII